MTRYDSLTIDEREELIDAHRTAAIRKRAAGLPAEAVYHNRRIAELRKGMTPKKATTHPDPKQAIQDAIHATIVSWQESAKWWELDQIDTGKADDAQDRFVDECLAKIKC